MAAKDTVFTFQNSIGDFLQSQMNDSFLATNFIHKDWHWAGSNVQEAVFDHHIKFALIET